MEDQVTRAESCESDSLIEPCDIEERDSSCEGEYVVERIIEKRINDDGVEEFLVKWEGWSEDTNTWEPLSNLVNCEDALARFRASESKIGKNSESDEEIVVLSESVSPKKNVGKGRSAFARKRSKPIVEDDAESTSSGDFKPSDDEASNWTGSSASSSPGDESSSFSSLSEDDDCDQPSTRKQKACPASKKTKLDERESKRNSDRPGLEADQEDDRPSDSTGFARGLAPKKVLAVVPRDVRGPQGDVVDKEILYLMQWKKSEKADLVTSNEAKQRCPELLIRYFQDKLKW